MGYSTYIPQPPLSEFVAVLWLSEGDAPAHARERLLPTGTVEVVINLGDDEMRVYDWQDQTRFQSFQGTLLCGPHSECFVIDTAQQGAIIGVAFKPGGAHPFFKTPAAELHNTHVSLDTLWGNAAGDLREQLLAACAPAARFRLLEQTLLAQAARPLTHHPAVAVALAEFRGGSTPRPIGDVTEQVGLSRRHFIQLFRQEVGLTPKLFGRLQRFQTALRCLGSGQAVDWADLALGCGYFDQAHFIHDFQAFAGLSPTAYLSRRSEHLNHLPLPD